MTYDPFSFADNKLLQQLPTSSVTGAQGTTYGYGGRPQITNYGFGQTKTFQPSLLGLQASQKSEFERLQGIQGLQSQALQMQAQTLSLEQQKREAEKQNLMDAARNYVASNITRSGILQGVPPKDIPQYMIAQAKNEYLSSKMQSGGGFTSWSIPAFPSGGMGGG